MGQYPPQGFISTLGTSIEGSEISDNTVADADILAHTSTKITITAKPQLNANVLYADQNNTLAEAANIILGTVTGTKIGTATTQKIGFYNAVPVIQRTGIADVDASVVDGTYDANEQNVLTSCRTKINAILQALEDMGITAVA